MLTDDSMVGPTNTLSLSISNSPLLQFWNTLTSWVGWILHCLPPLWCLLYKVSFLLLKNLQFLQIPLESFFPHCIVYSQVNSYSHDFNAENDVFSQDPSSELQVHTFCFSPSPLRYLRELSNSTLQLSYFNVAHCSKQRYYVLNYSIQSLFYLPSHIHIISSHSYIFLWTVNFFPISF